MKKKGEGKNKKAESVRKTRRIGESSKREEILQKAGAYSAVFFMAFFVALISASAFTPVDNSEAATNMNVTYNGNNYSLSLASYGGGGASEVEGTVSMDLTGTTDGAMAVEYDRVNVITNSKGYKIYLGMADSSQKLLNQTATGSGEPCASAATTSNCYFGPTSGTVVNPVKLTVNTWGFALPKKSGESSAAIQSNYGFDENYVTTTGKISNGASAISPTDYAIDTDNKFAAVPAAGSEVVVATGDTTATGAGRNYYVYYGINANTGLIAGTYTGTVVYTAIAEASSAVGGEMSISPNAQTDIDQTQSITLATSLYASDSLMAQIQSAGGVTVKIGGKDCTGVTTTKGSDGTLNISCTTPTTNRWGSYDVVASVGEYGSFKLAKGYSYYTPYNDMVNDSNKRIMQQFTTKTCEEMPAPVTQNNKNYTGSLTNDDYHAVGSYHTDKNHWYDYKGEQTDTNPISEIQLKDSRTGDVYRVRKLADGNCWMADNLKLTLSMVDGEELNSITSDINYDMDHGNGIDGTETTPRVISNPSEVNPLGTYSTNESTGVISWTPYAKTQTTNNTSWGSQYKGANCATRVSASEGSDSTTKTFVRGSGDTETETIANGKVVNNECAEYARSYDNGNTTLPDGDGISQSYGTYYNWYAATAGSGTYASSTQWGDTLNSVCPANWQLPDASTNDSKSFQNLFISKYGLASGSNSATNLNPGRSNDVVQKAPFSIVRSGYYYWPSGSLNLRGSNGLYWSRESNSGTSAYNLNFHSTYFAPQTTNNKVNGFTVRCVAR